MISHFIGIIYFNIHYSQIKFIFYLFIVLMKFIIKKFLSFLIVLTFSLLIFFKKIKILNFF